MLATFAAEKGRKLEAEDCFYIFLFHGIAICPE
jgi:hypothetical protein